MSRDQREGRLYRDQPRHHEWLRFRTVDSGIVRRIRADSERIGLELADIVDGWRAQPSG